jgi:saccharopine dehydrogenase (NAD+, L-lysine-forming)
MSQQSTRVLLVGAGHVGAAIAHLLSATNDYQLLVTDRDPARLDQVGSQHVTKRPLDIADAAAVDQALQGQDAVISACPYFLSLPLARAACAAGVHYFDMTEDVATAQQIRALAADARTALVPQCGLAPGFISIAAYDLANRFGGYFA